MVAHVVIAQRPKHADGMVEWDMIGLMARRHPAGSLANPGRPNPFPNTINPRSRQDGQTGSSAFRAARTHDGARHRYQRPAVAACPGFSTLSLTSRENRLQDGPPGNLMRRTATTTPPWSVDAPQRYSQHRRE
jgi:hypothetical protein